MERRLSALMAADVHGFSALMADDEDATIARLARLRALIDKQVTAHGGRVFSQAGDGFLCEFSSPIAAVRSAHELQNELASQEAVDSIGLKLRIGLHLADVVVSGDDLLGDGVNIASRIEALSEPGSVLVSGPLFEMVKRNAQLAFRNIGERRFKNITEPVALYQLIGEIGVHSYMTAAHSEPAAAPAAAARPHSIVVVPFANMSGDAEQEYFADGFSEDIITELSRFTDLFTISRNASLGLKGLYRDAREIGRQFNVQYVLEGGIRKLGNRVRINAHLTEAATGEQIWTEKSDCSLDELFDLEDELVGKIVAAVIGRIERAAEARARRKRPTDMAAYDCLLRGLEFHRISGVTVENAREALKWFNLAIDKDPSYGRAYAWQACSLATVAEWEGKDVIDEISEISRRSLEIDEPEAESHRIAGSLAVYKRDFERAEYHFNRALQLNPNHAYIVGRMGELYNFLGDGQKALDYQERAKQLDPFLPEYYRELEAIAHYVIGNYDACHRVVGEFPRLARRAAAYRAAAAVHLDDPARLRSAVHALLNLDPAFDPAGFITAETYKDEARVRALRDDLETALRDAHIKQAV